MKAQVIERIKADLGQIDLLVYSLASPVRAASAHRRAVSLGDQADRRGYHVKTLNVDRGVVTEVDLEPATPDEIAATVAVMGGEDWEFWIDALQSAGVLAPGFRTMSYTYIGTELTWPIYWHATLGKAKEDLDRAARAITQRLAALNGEARVAVLKFVVSQASSAIPVVPLYGSLLYRVMKDAGVHENTIEHIDRLFRTQLYSRQSAAARRRAAHPHGRRRT